MSNSVVQAIEEQLVCVTAGPVRLDGNLTLPEGSRAVVLFAHGSGSSRHSSRNRHVARLLNEAKLATLLIDLLTEARGKAAAIVQEAEGYKLQTVAQATGQVSRFNQIYEQYKKAPEVTRERLYLETMERVLAGTDKIILDQSGGQGQGVVPYLPLGPLTPRAGEGDRK